MSLIKLIQEHEKAFDKQFAPRVTVYQEIDKLKGEVLEEMLKETLWPSLSKEVKSFITACQKQIIEEIKKECEGMKIENPYRDSEIDKKDPLGHYANVHKEVGKNIALIAITTYLDNALKNI